jgi:LDH2 family malate/lactate/ureidoglycolate dehydrogenase
VAHPPLLDDLVLTPEALRDAATRALRGAGTDADIAGEVARSLVESDLRGVSSHGVLRVGEYVSAIRRRLLAPAARPRLVSTTPTVVVDGQRGFGQLGARLLVEETTARAREAGVALGTLAGVRHVGRLGEWAELAANDGCVAILLCNCGDPGGNVAPFGGSTARLGTNPLAYAVPAAGRPPVVADFSTSAVAEGKVRLHLKRGQRLPERWLVDATGTRTDDPAALYDGGAILPMGGHKGYALGLLVELLGGALSGAGCASLGQSPGNGVTAIVVDPDATPGGAAFAAQVAAVLAAVAEPSAPSDRVLAPGDPELESRRRAEREGIRVAAAVWAELQDHHHGGLDGV